MGEGDLGLSPTTPNSASVAKIKRGYDEFRRLWPLQLEFMEQHEQLAERVPHRVLRWFGDYHQLRLDGVSVQVGAREADGLFLDSPASSEAVIAVERYLLCRASIILHPRRAYCDTPYRRLRRLHPACRRRRLRSVSPASHSLPCDPRAAVQKWHADGNISHRIRNLKWLQWL